MATNSASIDTNDITDTFLQNLQQGCIESGFDVCDPIHTAWYNNLIEKEGHVKKGTLKKLPVPDTRNITEDERSAAKVSSSSLSSLSYNAVLIGNSKSIWPEFIKWIHARYKLNDVDVICHDDDDEDERKKELDLILQNNPFDEFVTDTLLQVLKSCFDERGAGAGEEPTNPSGISSYEIFWSSGNRSKVDLNSIKVTNTNTNTKNATTEQYHCYASKDESFLVSMQRVAKVTGKYWHDEDGSKLCVHPTFGTWKAFRAVVVFHNCHSEHSSSSSGEERRIPLQPPYCPCPVLDNEIQAAKEVMEYAIRVSSGISNIDYGARSTSIVSGDGSNDGSNDQDRLCTYLHNTVTPGSDWSKVPPSMKPWIQLRDCITIGREEHKYSDPQLLYHYTKDPDILISELKKRIDGLASINSFS
eukprot:scaffold5212_cov262-Chaetoceros_neogracile.AAC.2